MTVRVFASAPPTMTASQTRARRRRCADAKTFALDEHAVETDATGPFTPQRSRNRAAGAAMSMRSRWHVNSSIVELLVPTTAPTRAGETYS